MACCKEQLNEILSRDQNKFCADCDRPDPDWCNLGVGVLVCNNCAGVHRGLNMSARVKSIKLDSWNVQDIENVTGNGINEKLETHIPPYYLKPNADTPMVIRDSFIRDKYDSKLFENKDELEKSSMFIGEKSGFMNKKGKANEQWKPRFFVLKGTTLEYFIKLDDIFPKVSVLVKNLVVKLESINPSIYAITFTNFAASAGPSRSYFAYSQTNRETIEWYYSIIAAQYKVTTEGLGCKLDFTTSTTLVQRSGYLHKPGPSDKDSWKRRWFYLTSGHLTYFKEKLDAHPKGEIVIGSKSEGFVAYSGEIEHHKKSPFEHTFLFITPQRTYKLCAESRDEMEFWVKSINNAIDMNQKET